MATNNFKPFAVASGANVTEQSAYEALIALSTGFQSGKASSAQINKAIRQATTIGALIGQFIADSDNDALDNGDISGLVEKFTEALNKNLSLGTAATKNIGESAGQVPDMSSFGISTAGNGYQKLPSGLIIQWGNFVVSSTSGGVGITDITFPIAFPVAFRSSSAIFATNDPTTRFVGFDTANTNKSKIRYTYVTGTNNQIYWIALGY